MDQLAPMILLVEDSEDDAFIMTHALQKSGIAHSLQRMTDGQQALDYLGGTGEYADRQRHPLPKIIFLDLKLPYVHGFDILTWIRQQASLKDLHVVVLTGSSEKKDYERAHTLGACAYLVKPPTVKSIKDVFDSLAATNQ